MNRIKFVRYIYTLRKCQIFLRHFGAFISCKGMYSIGKGKYEYKSSRDASRNDKWKLSGFMITPSAGLVICF